MGDYLFDAPGEPWIRVEPALAKLRRTVLYSCLAVGLVAVVVASLLVTKRLLIGIPVLLVAAAWGDWVIGRSVANCRYAERDEDLWITHGALFRRLVVVPYGRMQLVDVRVGPVERRFGLATVQLRTAAATTDAVIPGLRPEVAARIRDRLTELGESGLSGL